MQGDFLGEKQWRFEQRGRKNPRDKGVGYCTHFGSGGGGRFAKVLT